MLASSGIEPPEGPDWLLEVKWDGYRAIAIVERTNVRLLSRNGLSLGKKFEKVVAELERLNFNSAILECPFDPRPKAKGVQWVKPNLVCEVAFHEWTSDGKLRALAFLGLREDKSPTEVVREPLASPAASEQI